MKFTIKNRFSLAVIFECEAASFGLDPRYFLQKKDPSQEDDFDAVYVIYAEDSGALYDLRDECLAELKPNRCWGLRDMSVNSSNGSWVESTEISETLAARLLPWLDRQLEERAAVASLHS